MHEAMRGEDDSECQSMVDICHNSYQVMFL